MAILIDKPVWPSRGRFWAHLISDSDLNELHDFAERGGIPRRGFELDHYDVPEERWQHIVDLGARPVTMRELVRALEASGLRVHQRDRNRA